MASRPKFWPRPRPQTFGLGLVSISLSFYVIRHFSGKSRLKFGNFVNFSGNNLKSYVVNHYLILFHNYFWPQPWPQPPEIGLGLEVLASFNITAFMCCILIALSLSLSLSGRTGATPFHRLAARIARWWVHL